MSYDFGKVTELLPGAHLELSSKVHDHLSKPRGCVYRNSYLYFRYNRIGFQIVLSQFENTIQQNNAASPATRLGSLPPRVGIAVLVVHLAFSSDSTGQYEILSI